MIVTEEEARTKICPMMTERVSAKGYAEPVLARQRCLASQCMKWNWGTYRSPQELQERKPWRGEDVGPLTGYCSL